MTETGAFKVTKLTAADAGCIIDGHIGWRAQGRLIEWAADHGYAVSSEDWTAIHRWMRGDIGDGHDLDHEAVTKLADAAEAWLNDNVAPEGFSFGWHDGEYFLWADAEWEQD